ncbi:MAG: hypothetical protein AAFO57_01370 [Pseudomonadota bacterium]
MSDIFEEVEEEVRKDKLGELWAKFGWIVWLAAAAIVGYVAFSEWRSSQLQAQRAEQAAALEAAVSALEAGEFEEAQYSLQAIVEEDSSLSPLAAHLLAQSRYVGGGDPGGAATVLNDTADADGTAFERLALLKSVYLRAETMTLADMETELAPLISTESQLGALAEELIATKAFAIGDFARARRDYTRLSIAANAPAGLQQRARIALDTIPRSTPQQSPEGGDTDGQTPEDPE